jgi:predicted metal-dependent HD superfamily phosphohydrolase
MPRYFFNLCRQDMKLDDAEGQLLQDADEAWEAARAAAMALMETDVPNATAWLNSSFEVRDEHGEVVLEFPFNEAIKGAQHQPS